MIMKFGYNGHPRRSVAFSLCFSWEYRIQAAVNKETIMAFPNANARQQYLKTQVETATKEQLVVMLFDGIVRFTEQARKAIETKQIEDGHNALMRAQAIVMELICTVDKEKGGEVASNLLALHAYSFNCLIKANMYKDIKQIDEVQKIYRELRQGWVGAMDSLGIGTNNANMAHAAGQKQPAKAAAPAPRTIGTPPPKGGAPAPAKTLPTAGKIPIQKPANPAPLPSKPITGPGGTIARVLPAAPAAAAAAAPAPAPAAPAEPAKPAIPATGYGMGRSAMMGAAFAKPAAVPPATRPVAAPAPVAAAAPAPAPAAAAPAPAAKPTTPMNAKQAAMLNAYQNSSRSIA